jgi:hypothetical protein
MFEFKKYITQDKKQAIYTLADKQKDYYRIFSTEPSFLQPIVSATTLTDAHQAIRELTDSLILIKNSKESDIYIDAYTPTGLIWIEVPYTQIKAKPGRKRITPKPDANY